MHAFYLHGFASSPRSTKAAFLGDRLARRGVTFDVPDFNEPDFSTLTVTRMVDQVRRAIAGVADPRIVLIGSSLGGFVALHVAAREPSRVRHLVLLAPALDFGANRMRDLGDEGMARWRDTGGLDVFHYGCGEQRTVHFELYRDAARYDSFGVPVVAPMLILQGTRDESVDPGMVQRFAQSRPGVALRLLDDDHQLGGSLEEIWRATETFLGLSCA